MALQICLGAEQSVLCSVPCCSDQVWDRRAETVKSKLSAVEMDLLQNLWPIFFRFARGNTFAAAIRDSLVSVPVHFIVITVSYVFVKTAVKYFVYGSSLCMCKI